MANFYHMGQRFLWGQAFGFAMAGLPQSLEAGVGLLGGIGGVAGTFQKAETRAPIKGLSYFINPTWFPEFGGFSSFSLGLIIKQMKFGYTDQAAYKRATYNLYGINAGVFKTLGESMRLQFLAEYYSTADLSSLSTHTDLVNGNNFKYSTLQVYGGTPATGGRVNLTHDKTDGQFTKSNRYRSGLGVSVIQQKLSSETTEIQISNSVLSPGSLFTKSEVSYSLTVISIDFFVGLTF